MNKLQLVKTTPQLYNSKFDKQAGWYMIKHVSAGESGGYADTSKPGIYCSPGVTYIITEDNKIYEITSTTYEREVCDIIHASPDLTYKELVSMIEL